MKWSRSVWHTCNGRVRPIGGRNSRQLQAGEAQHKKHGAIFTIQDSLLQGRETIDKSDESSSKRQSLVEPFDREKCEMKLAVKVGNERNLNFTDWHFVSSKWTDQTLKTKIAEEEEGEMQGTTK